MFYEYTSKKINFYLLYKKKLKSLFFVVPLNRKHFKVTTLPIVNQQNLEIFFQFYQTTLFATL